MVSCCRGAMRGSFEELQLPRWLLGRFELGTGQSKAKLFEFTWNR